MIEGSEASFIFSYIPIKYI